MSNLGSHFASYLSCHTEDPNCPALNGRRPYRQMTFNGKQLSMKLALKGNTTFNGRRSPMENKLQRKHSEIKDALWWKIDHLNLNTTFYLRWHSLPIGKVNMVLGIFQFVVLLRFLLTLWRLKDENDDSVKEAPTCCRSFLDNLYTWKWGGQTIPYFSVL